MVSCTNSMLQPAIAYIWRSDAIWHSTLFKTLLNTYTVYLMLLAIGKYYLRLGLLAPFYFAPNFDHEFELIRYKLYSVIVTPWKTSFKYKSINIVFIAYTLDSFSQIDGQTWTQNTKGANKPGLREYNQPLSVVSVIMKITVNQQFCSFVMLYMRFSQVMMKDTGWVSFCQEKTQKCTTNDQNTIIQVNQI